MVLSIRNETAELSFRPEGLGIGIFLINIKTLKQVEGDTNLRKINDNIRSK